MYRIEHRVTVPNHSRRGRLPRYPFRDLAVGESFLVMNHFESARGAVASFKRRNPGWGYRTQTVWVDGKSRDGERVLRIWRIE